MARVTVEDCIEKVENRFELVSVAVQRTKDISSGAPVTINRDNDKNTVIALREIAGGSIDVAALRESLISSLRVRNKFFDKIQDENLHAEIQDLASTRSSDVEENINIFDQTLDSSLDSSVDDIDDDIIIDN